MSSGKEFQKRVKELQAVAGIQYWDSKGWRHHSQLFLWCWLGEEAKVRGGGGGVVVRGSAVVAGEVTKERRSGEEEETGGRRRGRMDGVEEEVLLVAVCGGREGSLLSLSTVPKTRNRRRTLRLGTSGHFFIVAWLRARTRR